MDSVDGINVLKTMVAHRQYLQIAIEAVARELTERGARHDLSKLYDDEFSGFASINRVAREHPYGSQEYKDSLKSKQDVIDLHYSRNSHHPEFHAKASDMGAMDIIEMVCDWWSARHTYGKSQPWEDTIKIQFERFDFSQEQAWLISELATFLQTYEMRTMGSA